MHVSGMVGHLVRRLHQISTQHFAARALAAGIDLTPVQFAALDALNANPGIDQARVAELAGSDRVTTGGVIDRLVAKGLVARRVSTLDRRARELHLTDAGKATFEALLPEIRSVQESLLRGLSAEERATLVGLLRKAIASA